MTCRAKWLSALILCVSLGACGESHASPPEFIALTQDGDSVRVETVRGPVVTLLYETPRLGAGDYQLSVNPAGTHAIVRRDEADSGGNPIPADVTLIDLDTGEAQVLDVASRALDVSRDGFGRLTEYPWRWRPDRLGIFVRFLGDFNPDVVLLSLDGDEDRNLLPDCELTDLHPTRPLVMGDCRRVRSGPEQAFVNTETGEREVIYGLEYSERLQRFVRDLGTLSIQRNDGLYPEILRVRDASGAVVIERELNGWMAGAPSPRGDAVPLFDEGRQEIAIWDAETDEIRGVQSCEEPMDIESPYAWSPDGRSYGALSCSSEAVVMNLEAGTLTLEQGAGPDGAEIAFERTGGRLLHGTVQGDARVYALYDGRTGAPLGDPRPAGLDPTARLVWRYRAP
ncbi:MAG: hypothetical protein AB8I08_33115 [Sandaracinaceae bacterium]